MKLILLLICALCFYGCMTEARYPNGGIAVRTWSDSTKLAFNGGGISLTADRISNSVPTRAALLGANKIAGTIGSAAVAIAVPGSGATSMVTKAVISSTPHITSPTAAPADVTPAQIWPTRP